MGSREWATLFWLAVVLAFCLFKPGLRTSPAQILRQLLNPKLLVSLGLIAGWCRLLLVSFTGFKYYLQSLDSAQKAGYFRES